MYGKCIHIQDTLEGEGAQAMVMLKPGPGKVKVLMVGGTTVNSRELKEHFKRDLIDTKFAVKISSLAKLIDHFYFTLFL